MTPLEIGLSAGALVALLAGHRLFDEWRGPIQLLTRLLVVGLIAWFGGRAFWRWWRERAVAIVRIASLIALGAAAFGWIVVVVVRAIAGMSGENFSLILLGPLAMLLGAVSALVGVLAAAFGAGIVITALSHRVPRKGLFVAAGTAAIVLNLWHVAALVGVFWRGGR